MRVIAGALRGRRLVAPRGLRTRPTSDRVREALFMMLEPWEGRRVVDLYAGSGALGIEALSRGAAHVDFVERSAPALAVLRTNLEALGVLDRAHVWRVALPGGIARLREPLAAADVVLADPPYGGGEARRALAALGAADVLPRGCRVVLEHHVKDAVPDAVGRMGRAGTRRYGETVVTWYEAGSTGPASSEEERRA